MTIEICESRTTQNNALFNSSFRQENIDSMPVFGTGEEVGQ
jgi:hypothetical protein